MRLKSIMTAPVEVIGPHASVVTAARQLNMKGIHHLVVVNRGVVAGLLTSDILMDRRNEGALRVEDAMLRNITIATPDTTVAELARLMAHGTAQTAVPIVRGRRLVGIVTISDLLHLVETARRVSGRTAGLATA